MRQIFVVMLATLLPLSNVAAATSNEYKLGAGDQVRIAVYNNPDLATEAQISEDGSISFPLLGKVVIGGLSKTNAESLIAKSLTEGGFLRQANVNLAVTEYRSQQVSVLGEVNKPGKYSIQSSSGVMDLLAQAGGITSKGARAITVVRHDANGVSNKQHIALDQLMDANRGVTDIALSNGDLIFVPQQSTFYIYGQVQKPGVYPLEPNMTVRQAIVVGGGLTVRGTERGVRIVRPQPNGQPKKLKAKLSDRLNQDDVVEIKESLF
ncbi:MAG: polysaccharide export protein EpsE [Candidatus Obscuribacterales bacterium]|nr:polysaccharide export protein EpsE [Steroidobacteraceae bacterium]